MSDAATTPQKTDPDSPPVLTVGRMNELHRAAKNGFRTALFDGPVTLVRVDSLAALIDDWEEARGYKKQSPADPEEIDDAD
ncbi:hypothetical protein [Alienimonas sp. DA493]|uniref:hypothetical protein n=1 Tax=Alienimonas sp. DA493 TaxID=3373605 RepID=UPI003754DA57